MSADPHTPRPSHRGQDGVGLVLVIVIGAALLAMAALSQAMFSSAIHGADRHVKREQVVALAETGIDQTISRLQTKLLRTDGTTGKRFEYNTDKAALGGLYGGYFDKIPATATTPAAERDWALAQAAAAPAAALQRSTSGEFVTIRPSNRSTVYTVAWVPTRAAHKRRTFVKAEYLPANYSPEHALLVGSKLQMAGNAGVFGINGSVHANGDITVGGSSTTIEKTVSTSGGFSPDPPSFQSVGGTEKNAPTQDIPQADPLDFWEQHAGRGEYRNAWFDLCPGGNIYQVVYDPVTQPVPPSAPCVDDAAATLVGNYASPGDYGGWSYKATGNTWQKSGAASNPGVFYAHHASIDLSGSPGSAAAPWQATLIASSSTTTAEACGGGPGNVAGYISVSGGPVLQAFGQVNGLAMMAGRDLKLNGTTQTQLMGLFAAHEQVDISGNGTLEGSVLGEDACDTPSSEVHMSQVGGSMKITFNKNVSAAFGQVVRTVLWQEVTGGA